MLKKEIDKIVNIANAITKKEISKVDNNLLNGEIKEELFANGVEFINNIVELNKEIDFNKLKETVKTQLPIRMRKAIKEVIYINKRKLILPNAFKKLRFKEVYSTNYKKIFMNKQGKIRILNTDSFATKEINVSSGFTFRQIIKNYALGMPISHNIEKGDKPSKDIKNVLNTLGFEIVKVGRTESKETGKDKLFDFVETAYGYNIDSTSDVNGETSILKIFVITAIKSGEKTNATTIQFTLIHEEAVAIWNAIKEITGETNE